MAYVRRLPSGKWSAVVRHPSGVRRSFSDPLKRVVVAWAAEQEAAFRAGAAATYRDRNAAVAVWHQHWWAARQVEAGTARKEEAALRLHVLPYWGSWPLSSIGRLEVQAWVNQRAREGAGPDSLRTSYGVLASMLGEAVREGVLLASPCTGVKLPRRPKPPPRWFTRDEYERIQMALETRTIASGGRKWVADPHRHVWQALVGVACYTGLRPSELAGLDVRHLDLRRGMVYVEQVWTQEGVLRPYGKSDNSHRWVPFPPQVADLVWRVVADKNPTAPAFTMPRGGRLEFQGNVRNSMWVPTLAAAGIDPVRFYTCRHTFASWAVQVGVPDRKIIGYLGHADAHLVSVYAHLDPSQHDEIRAMWGETPRRPSDPRPLGATEAPGGTGRSEDREWLFEGL